MNSAPHSKTSKIKCKKMDLLQQFKNFVYTDCGLSHGETWLIAVSGGLDSISLCELCHQTGQQFEIIHANFQLRGEESTRDEEFVQMLARKYNIPVHIKKFNAEEYATKNKLSIQVAARKLRYDWFLETLEANKPKLRWLATAHHQDDNIETILMNFFKGTGIAGLRGILPVQDEIIRPLLFATREDLQAFALENALEWVEDSSNATDKYTRNYFRHKLIPIIKDIFPEAEANLAGNIKRFREIESIYRQSIDQHRKRLLEQRGAETFIPVLKLAKTDPLNSIVYEIIKDFGFTPHQTQTVIDLLETSSGKFVCSATHRILRDRAWLIVSPLNETPTAHILIESPKQAVQYANGTLQLSLEETPDQLNADPNIALLDAKEIRFPLLLRKWRTGDYFYPLGMRKKKKLGRFFIDNKRSLAQKEKIWVLEMDKKIVWIVGMRIDDRFKIQPGTREVLKIETRLA